MTATQSLKIYEILQRHFKDDADAKVVAGEIEQIVENKFTEEKKELSLSTEMQMLRKDMAVMLIELLSKIDNAALRTESNLKTEINKLIVWIIATMFGAAALFTALAKVFFDK